MPVKREPIGYRLRAIRSQTWIVKVDENAATCYIKKEEEATIFPTKGSLFRKMGLVQKAEIPPHLEVVPIYEQEDV